MAAARIGAPLIERACRQGRIELLVSAPSVGQHVGDVSARFPSRRPSKSPLFKQGYLLPSIVNIRMPAGIGQPSDEDEGNSSI